MDWIYDILIVVVPTSVSSLITWFLTKRKYNSEVDSSNIQNMKDSLDFYTSLSNDNKKRLEEVLEANKELRERNNKLEDKCDKLEEKINKMSTEMFNLLGQICLNMQCTLRERGIPLYNSKPQNNNGNKIKKKV